MSPTSAASGCCAAAVRQQKEATLQQHQPERSTVPAASEPKKFCTVVENGRVVVRPVGDE